MLTGVATDPRPALSPRPGWNMKAYLNSHDGSRAAVVDPNRCACLGRRRVSKYRREICVKRPQSAEPEKNGGVRPENHQHKDTPKGYASSVTSTLMNEDQEEESQGPVRIRVPPEMCELVSRR